MSSEATVTLMHACQAIHGTLNMMARHRNRHGEWAIRYSPDQKSLVLTLLTTGRSWSWADAVHFNVLKDNDLHGGTGWFLTLWESDTLPAVTPEPARRPGQFRNVPIIGQEAIVAGYGLGRVLSYSEDFPNDHVKVQPYVIEDKKNSDRFLVWPDTYPMDFAPKNVTLIPPGGGAPLPVV